ncbi:MAG: SH3 domain-containing protein [Burkholderiaceae bacterium]|nr:SH3 domain-containing protein [Burkholderiaceae bacterium]
MTGRWLRLVLATLGTGLLAAAAQGAEYRSVTASAAVLYDAPSARSKKMFIGPRGMPLEVLSTLPAWIKVRDVTGDVLWVARADLGPVTQVVARRLTNLRAEPKERAAVGVQVAAGVLLEVLGDDPSGWIKVRHAEGAIGYVKADEIFGR